MKASDWRETPTLGTMPYEAYRAEIEKNLDLLIKELDGCRKTCERLKDEYEDIDVGKGVMKLVGAEKQLGLSEVSFDLFRDNLMKLYGIFTGDVQVTTKGER